MGRERAPNMGFFHFTEVPGILTPGRVFQGHVYPGPRKEVFHSVVRVLELLKLLVSKVFFRVFTLKNK